MFTLIVSGVSCLLVLWSAWGMKRWIPEWWRVKAVRLFTVSWIVLTLIADALYLGGIELGAFETYQLGKFIWAISIIVAIPMAGALTLCFMLAARKSLRHGGKAQTSSDSKSRRTFLKLAVIPPVLAGGASIAGLVRAQANPIIHKVEIQFATLPDSIDGLTILHLTDAHLGPFIGIDSIDHTIDALKDTRIDVIAITGDFADHLRLMKPAIERLEKLKPTYGLFFSMGNHEYYHPEGKVEDQLADLTIQPLISSGISVRVGDATLYVAGADDPARTEEDKAQFLKLSIEKALASRPSDAFTILLSHRPTGFDAAQDLDVDLTLAGDTHGYQFGVFGHSALHPLFGQPYPRGHYQRGRSQLYTSTGFGHWFPFRLGCDREAALIVLKQSTS